MEDFDKALKQFSNVLAINPNETESLYLSGLILKQEEQLEGSIEFLEKAVKLDSDNPDYILALAEAFDSKSLADQDFKALDQAMECYQRALEIVENNEETCYKLAICFARKGMWKECVDYCKKVLEINDKSARAYNQMGLAMYCNSDYDEAISMYQKAIEIDPKYLETYNNYGFVLEKQGDFEQAIAVFKKYMKLFEDPESKKDLKSRVKELNVKEGALNSKKKAMEEHIKQLEDSVKNKNQNNV